MKTPFRFSIRLYAGVALAAIPAFSSESDEEFRRLLRGLASEAFQERAAAAENLGKWVKNRGDDAKDRLAAEMERSDDPEVELRLRQVLMEAVVRDEMAAGPGYIGIAPADVALPGAENRELGAVSVLFVAPGMPGERAGLKPGDAIVALDDRPWASGQAAEAFRTEIAARKPGTKVRLKVLRLANLRTEEIEVELAPRPLVSPDPAAGILGALRGEPVDPKADDERARENLFRAWMDRWRLDGMKPDP